MGHKRHPLIRELWALLLLLLAALGFFWRILFTPDAWKPAGGGDLVSFLFPMYRFAAASLRAGELPLWNPHLYGGAPFLADMQSGLFYPPNLLLFLLAPEFNYRAMEWMVVFHVFLAGSFMYLCLRYMEPGRSVRMPAALAGATAYMFSDLFILHFGNLNLVAVAAWLPLIFLLFWRALRTRSLWLAAGAGIAFGVSTLAGHLQITLFIGLALVVAAAVEALTKNDTGHQDGGGGRDWAWSLLVLAITVAVAIGLAAVVLLPTFEYTQLSPRATLSYREAARYSLVPALLGEMLVPALFSSREPSLYWGVWDRVAVGYLGIFPLILAFLAILLVRGRRVRIFVVLAVVAFLLALGGESILHGWVYELLPGFGQLRAPARFVLLVGFALSALSAIGLDRLLAPLDRPRRRLFDSAWRGLLWLAGAAAIAGGLWAYLVIYQSQDRDPVLFWRVSMAGSGVIFALLLLGAALAWLSARRSGRLKRGTLAWLAVGLIFLDLASLGAYTDLGDEPPTSGYDHPRAVEYLQGQPDFFRIDSRTDVADKWQPNLALLAGLYDVNGVDNPLVIADVARFWSGTGGRSTPLYDFMGARYVLGSKDVALDWNKFSLAFDGDPTVNVYRNETTMPRALVVHQAVVVPSQESAWARIQEAGFDPASKVILEGGQPLDSTGGNGATAQVLNYGSNKLEIVVDTPQAGYLVLSDPFYPGWRAAVDGQEVELLRANYAFRAVAVSAGTHRVTMNFRPGTALVGAGISALTLLVLLILGIVALVRQRRENS